MNIKLDALNFSKSLKSSILVKPWLAIIMFAWAAVIPQMLYVATTSARAEGGEYQPSLNANNKIQSNDVRLIHSWLYVTSGHRVCEFTEPVDTYEVANLVSFSLSRQSPLFSCCGSFALANLYEELCLDPYQTAEYDCSPQQSSKRLWMSFTTWHVAQREAHISLSKSCCLCRQYVAHHEAHISFLSPAASADRMLLPLSPACFGHVLFFFFFDVAREKCT